MSFINKFFWELSNDRYQGRLCTGFYNAVHNPNLHIEPLPTTLDELKPRMLRISEKWHWADQPRYSDDLLAEKLAQPGTELFALMDGDEEIGYALSSIPSQEMHDKFWPTDKTVREIDNLGMYPGNEGGGRGKAFFEMLFTRYFPANDIVFWSQHDTHGPTLSRFYHDKLGMRLIATEQVEDFRPTAMP